jgi:cytochrome c peroxidase
MPEVLNALASFQRTLTSRRSRFDEFLDGRHTALTDQELKGMHLFRTKARCMNCHNGQFLTDNSFHNIGLTYYKRKYEDLGRYMVTKNPDDVGKFRTPSLRDVMNTDPWMHNGLFDNIIGLLNIYNSGMQMNTPTPAQKAADPLYPVTDPLMKKLNLSKEEIQDIAAFLNSVTATKYRMARPEKLPR